MNRRGTGCEHSDAGDDIGEDIVATTQAGAATQHLTIRCQFCDTWNRVDAARAADRPKCGKCAKPMLLDRPFALNDETFARTIAETDMPVLVDFYADWCGPCKIMAPYVDELAREKQGVALVAKLDTDRSQRTAAGFNIRSIPTTIVFKNGREMARQSGAVPKKVLEELLAKA
jgi:thioredoxin 2